MILARRSFLTGLVSVLAAPAIVRATSLMPVKSLPSPDVLDLLRARMDAAYQLTREGMTKNLYGDLTDLTRSAFIPRLFVQVYGAASG